MFWIGVAANAVGALLVFLAVGFVIALLVGPDERERIGRENGPAIAVYFAVVLPFTAMAARRAWEPIARWLQDDRPPTDAERRSALRLPLRLTKIWALGWGLAVPSFLLYNLGEPKDFVIAMTMSMVLGGLTTCAVGYLLAERTLRPVTAAALAATPPTQPVAPGVRMRLVTAWTLATGVPLLGIAVVAFIALVGTDAGADDVAGASLFLAAVAIGIGLFAMTFAARSIADPLKAVREALRRVEQGDLEVRVPVDDGSEIGLLEAGFNRMAEGLEERERMRDLFGRHVGRDVAHAALRSEVALGGEEREVAALFVDVVGSTALAARVPPTEVVELLNEFFCVVIEVTEDHGGLVNKFEGDAALCVFGAPVPRDDPAGDALAAARDLRDRLRAELPGIDAGVGVSAGRAVAGNIGSEERFEYTVIGDPVNEAARLCELSKQRAERLLASTAALERARHAERRLWEPLDTVTLRGREAETRLATVS
jgi:adenylate cyclase